MFDGFLEPGIAAWVAAAAVAWPLVWWLHRFLRNRTLGRVSALFLWTESTDEDRPGRRRDRADPAWIRRAAVLSLIALALADPTWVRPQAPRVVAWVDDGASLDTVEAGRARKGRLAERLAARLADLGADTAELRSLRHPGRRGEGLAGVIAQWIAPTPAPADLPPPSVLDPAARHLVLSDGVDPLVRAWAQGHDLDWLGLDTTARDNGGLLALSARRDLRDPARLALLAVAGAAADGPLARRLVVTRDGAPVAERALTLTPGREATVRLDLPLAGGPVTARLEPADALASDDILVLDPALLAPLALTLSGPCPPLVARVVDTHPGLMPGDGPGVHCGPGAPPGAVLVLDPPEPPGALQGPLLWPDTGRVRPLPPGLKGGPAPGTGRAVLRAGTVTVARRSAQGGPLVAALDLGAVTDPAAAALLLAGLLDRALDRSLLDPIARTTRPAPALAVAAPSTADHLRPGPDRGTRRPLAPWLMALALALLAWDLWRTGARRPEPEKAEAAP